MRYSSDINLLHLQLESKKENYPKTWEYLLENREVLEGRERGKWKHEKWYAFGRSQNLSEMEQSKLLTPSIAQHTSFTYDHEDYFYFVGSGGGGGGGYGVTLKVEVKESYLYILGLLNSKLLDTFLKTLSTPFSGGYYAYNRQYIEQLPIRTINFADPAEVKLHDEMVTLVERMLSLHGQLNGQTSEVSETSEVSAKLSPREREMLERQIEMTDAAINKLVYRLYGLTEEEIKIVEGEAF